MRTIAIEFAVYRIAAACRYKRGFPELALITSGIIPACRYKARYAGIGRVIASRLQIVLHLRDSYCTCPKMAESIGPRERGIDELTQDSRDDSGTVENETANNTQGTSIGLRRRRKS